MIASNCTDGPNKVENSTYFAAVTPPPPTGTSAAVQHSQQSNLTASQDTSSTTPTVAPGHFPSDASVAITVQLGGPPDVIQVVPALLTFQAPQPLIHYTTDNAEILRFEAGQLVFKTRLAVALAQNMASLVPSTNQQNIKSQIDAVNQSLAHTLKLANDLSLNISGYFAIPTELVPNA